MTGPHHALAKGVLINIPHFRLLQCHQTAAGQFRQQAARRLRIHRIHRRMHLAAGGYPQHRHALPHRIHQVPGSAITTGKHQQLRAGLSQGTGCIPGIPRAAGHLRMPDHLAVHSGVPATVLSHVPAPGQHRDLAEICQRLECPGHAGWRLGAGSTAQRLFPGSDTIAALQRHAPAYPCVGIDQDADYQ